MKKIILYISIFLLLAPLATKAAQDSYTLLEPLPCVQGVGGCEAGTQQKEISLNDYIGYIFKFSIALAAFLAVVMIIWGGFEYMLSDVPSSKLDGKSKIWNAIWGLLLVLAAYLILATIDPRLVEINTSIPAIKIDTSDVTKFQNQLSEDLKNLSSENQQKVIALENNITELKKEKETLDAQFQAGSISQEEHDKFTAKIDQIVKEDKAEQTKRFAQGSGLGNLRRAVDTLDTVENYYGTNTFGFSTAPYLNPNGEEQMNNYISNIDRDYEKHINELDSTNGNPQVIQQLKIEHVFFVEQIKEEKEVMEAVLKYNWDKSNGKDLKLYADNYKKQLNDIINPDPNNTLYIDPGINNQYKEILQSRLEKIQNALNKKP